MEQHGLSDRDAKGAPSSSVYARVLAHLLPDMPDSYSAMLRAHLIAPEHLISATKLAEAAGYSGYEGANLHYGKLGQRVADQIGFTPPNRDEGTEIWTCAIARDSSMDTKDPENARLEALPRKMKTVHFELQMRPQVAQALRSLGW